MINETIYTRSEILANRRKWIDYLKEPERKKAIGYLDKGNGERCCLGHACAVLGIVVRPSIGIGKYVGSVKRYGVEGDSSVDLLPNYVKHMLGMWSNSGCGYDSSQLLEGLGYKKLSVANDMSSMTPQEIGAYLETVIEGGQKTPFKPLYQYRED